MAVYVDNAVHPFGRMLMCHMMADTSEELLEMVDKIGVQRKWIQDKGLAQEHFDIAKSKRSLAVKFGAIEVGWRIGDIINKRIDAGLPSRKDWPYHKNVKP